MSVFHYLHSNLLHLQTKHEPMNILFLVFFQSVWKWITNFKSNNCSRVYDSPRPSWPEWLTCEELVTLTGVHQRPWWRTKGQSITCHMRWLHICLDFSGIHRLKCRISATVKQQPQKTRKPQTHRSGESCGHWTWDLTDRDQCWTVD